MKAGYAMSLIMLMGTTAFAGRPLTIDDADPVDSGQFEFEVGENHVKFSDCRHWDYPVALTYGIASDMEIGLGFGGQYETRQEFLHDSSTLDLCEENGIGDLVIALKWQFWKESDLVPRQAIAPSIKFPTADRDSGLGSGEMDYDIYWIASKSLSDKIGVHINVGYSWIGEPAGEDIGNILHYGGAADYQISDSIQLVGEVFAERELRVGTETAVQYSAGFRWNPADGLTLDMAGGTKISGDAPDLMLTAGLTLAFGSSSKNSNIEGVK